MKHVKQLLKQPVFHIFCAVLWLCALSWPFFAQAKMPDPELQMLSLCIPWGIALVVLFLISQTLDDNGEK